MALRYSYVETCMLCIKHNLMNTLDTIKRMKTVNNAWNLKIEFVKSSKPVSAREHDLGCFHFV